MSEKSVLLVLNGKKNHQLEIRRTRLVGDIADLVFCGDLGVTGTLRIRVQMEKLFLESVYGVLELDLTESKFRDLEFVEVNNP